MKKLFEINSELDTEALSKEFDRNSRVQVREFLTDETAREVRNILGRHTRWGMAMQAEGSEFSGPQQILFDALQTQDGREFARKLMKATHEAAAKSDYAFRYAQHSLVQNVQEGWDPEGPHQYLLEYLNAPDFLEFVRKVTGIEELVQADGQATLYAPQHFLNRHVDSHLAEGWRVAYVLNLTEGDWSPNWGGYLNFFDDDGDIIQGFKPRFNSLNLFRVPQAHAVAYVPPFAPVARYAITGWLRDR